MMEQLAERRMQREEDAPGDVEDESDEEDDDEDDEEGGWRAQDVTGSSRGSLDETVIKAGYLWKKGERRKVC